MSKLRQRSYLDEARLSHTKGGAPKGTLSAHIEKHLVGIAERVVKALPKDLTDGGMSAEFKGQAGTHVVISGKGYAPIGGKQLTVLWEIHVLRATGHIGVFGRIVSVGGTRRNEATKTFEYGYTDSTGTVAAKVVPPMKAIIFGGKPTVKGW